MGEMPRGKRGIRAGGGMLRREKWNGGNAEKERRMKGKRGRRMERERGEGYSIA